MLRRLLPILLLAAPVAPLAAQQSVAFTLIPSSSVLVGSGSINSIAFTPQASGSDRTQWMGTVNVNVDNIFNPTTLQITLSSFAALNSGTWQPAVGGAAGSAAANYGFNAALGIATGRIAVRGATTDAAMPSAVTVMSSGPGQFFFPVSGINTTTVTATGGAVDYNAGIFGQGTTPITGSSDNMTLAAAQLTISGNLATINIPVDITFNGTAAGLPTTFRIVGNLVGTATIPEPGVWVMLAVGVGCGAVLRRRGR